jgi:hypothetical protein
MSLKAGDITTEAETAFCSYRGKGGKTGRRELPRPAYDAIRTTLANCGKDLATMPTSESLWQACAGPAGITSGTFYGRFRLYLREAGLPPSGLHIVRHSSAKLRGEAGESVEAVSAFLDHSSLAVTTVYLWQGRGGCDRRLTSAARPRITTRTARPSYVREGSALFEVLTDPRGPALPGGIGMDRLGSTAGPDRESSGSAPTQEWSSEVGGDVVMGPHPVGRWRGPSERAWLRRIVYGAGFGLASWSAATARQPKSPHHRGRDPARAHRE